MFKCLEPICNIPRITLGQHGTTSPYELNGQIIYLSTSWYVATDSYEKGIEMTQNMVDLKGEIIFGSDFYLAAKLGRGESLSAILEKKAKLSPTFFALNYESRWVDCQPLMVAILCSKFSELSDDRCTYTNKK